ncbi:MAG TPA: hypothetical protein VGC71_02350 [Gaiellales bacterium]|jgi:hypothetical protein
MAYEPRTTAPPEVDNESGASRAARTTGRALLWVVIAVAILAVLIGVVLLGPFGLAIAVPALLIIWFAAAASTGGPAAGA